MSNAAVELSASTREDLERLERAARGRAATMLGLTQEETFAVDEVQRQSDARRALLESRVDPLTRRLTPAARGDLVANARDEFAGLTRILGAERAHLWRDFEAHSLAVELENAGYRRDQPSTTEVVIRARQVLLTTPFARQREMRDEGHDPPPVAPTASDKN